MKKRSFAMMEVSVAIMLFILCVIPLVGVPFKILTRHKKVLNRMQTYMHSHEAMFYLLQDFNKLHPNYQFERKKEGLQHKLPLTLPETTTLPEVHYYLHHNSESKKEQPDHNFLYCDICFDKLEDKKDIGRHRFFIGVKRTNTP